MRAGGPSGTSTAAQRIGGDHAPFPRIQSLAWAQQVGPPVGHVGIAGHRMLDEQHVILAVRVTGEFAPPLIRDTHLGNFSACFSTQLADADFFELTFTSQVGHSHGDFLIRWPRSRARGQR